MTHRRHFALAMKVGEEIVGDVFAADGETLFPCELADARFLGRGEWRRTLADVGVGGHAASAWVEGSGVAMTIARVAAASANSSKLAISA